MKGALQRHLIEKENKMARYPDTAEQTVKQIAKNIAFLRKEAGYTQQQVAAFLNVHRSTYTHYETGSMLLDFRTIAALCKYYEVTLYDLLYVDFPDGGRKRGQRERVVDLRKVGELSRKEKYLIELLRAVPDDLDVVLENLIGEC